MELQESLLVSPIWTFNLGDLCRGIGMFRAIAGLARDESIAITFGSFLFLVLLMLGGFLLAQGTSPPPPHPTLIRLHLTTSSLYLPREGAHCLACRCGLALTCCVNDR